MEERFPVQDSEGKKRLPEKAVSEAVAEVEKPVLTDLAEFVKGTETLLPSAAIGLFLLALVGFLYFSKPFLMPVVLAVLLSFLLKPVVRILEKARIVPPVGAVLVVFLFLGVFGVVVSHLVQPATEWVSSAPEKVRSAENKIRKLIRPVTAAAAKVEDMTKEPQQAPAAKVEVKQSGFNGAVFGFASSFFTGAIETVVLLYFLLAAGDLFLQKLVRILPTLTDKKKAVEITSELQHNISLFLFTITCINVGLGALVAVAVSLIGMPNAILWGVVAALLNFIPYFGPISGVAVLGLAGFVTFDSVGHALLPPAIYLGLHAVEANLITPMILGRRLTMNPVVIFLSLMFWTWLWGIPGALLSVPLLMMLKIFCDHFKPLSPLGEFLSGETTAKEKVAQTVDAIAR